MTTHPSDRFGFVFSGGGITRLLINGKPHRPDDVARAVESYEEMLALARDYRGALEFYSRADLKTGDEEGARLKQITINYVDSVISKAEGRS